ncbi:hypothetical protein JW964_26310 [candidate division KSB1 bacterium]|nr:hypothetical protein [candidate division KSB1 bacterium]
MKIKQYYRGILILILLAMIPGVVLAQLQSHEIGRLWVTNFPTGSMPNYAPIQNQMTFPGGDFFYQRPKNLERVGVWIGVKNWTDNKGVFNSFFVAECGPSNFEALDYAAPISNKKTVRNRLPLVYSNKVKETRFLDSRTGSTRKADLTADEMITMVWTTRVGITITKNSYAFAHRKYDSFIIEEYLFENTGNMDKTKTTIELPNQNLEGVYFGFLSAFMPSGDYGHELLGGQHDDWVHYYGSTPGDTLRGLWYSFDGDNQIRAFDDIGDPSETTGEFLSPQYVGTGIIHADKSVSDPADDLTQPATINWWPSRHWYSHTLGDPEQTLYAELSSGKKSLGTDVTEFRNAYEPEIQHPLVYFAFGPYNIPFGQKIRIVIYRAGGMISRKVAIESGRQWKLGQLEFGGLKGDEAKKALLATGKDSLFRMASRAEWAWKNELKAVPDGPPAPGLNLDAGPGKIDLQWDAVDTEPDPDTGQLDFEGYRLFRAVDHYTNEYQMIWECGGKSANPVATSYIDFDVERGRSYYYYVVAYDKDGNESSHFYNRNYQYGLSPFLGARDQLDSVFVVPNPFHAQGLAYGGTIEEDYREIPRVEDRLYFVGLPARAKIRIFTVYGDLVTTIEHPDPSDPLSIPNSADRSWHQISMSWQTIRSGVYFFHVEGWDRDGNNLGTTTGKFVVIR